MLSTTANTVTTATQTHLELQENCQGTLIFSNISIVYSSFPSTTFYFTSLYYSSKMSTIISNYLQASPSTTLSSPLPFVMFSSVLSFTFLISPLNRLRVDTDFTNDPYVYFIFTYVYFYLHFYLHFTMLLCLTFISMVLIFLSQIVIDYPLAGLYPFLLGSPARCTDHCNYPCQ